MSEFQIRKNDLANGRIVETRLPAANNGEIVLKVDKFAFTANNLTYGVMGEQIGYWQFFPPQDNESGQWGIIPVWGFADVIESKVDGIDVGERLFGYFPPASYLSMAPVGVSALRLIDGSAHRAQLPPGYNMYRRVKAEPGYNAELDNERMLLFPLHITSFCLWDCLQDHAWYGAKQTIIISASSKTSIGLAYALQDDENAPPTIGLTSKRNLEFVNKLGIYTSALSYDDIATIDTSIPTVIVDMSGNAPLLAALHSQLGDNMLHCINVGLTHWEESHSDEGINTQRSEFFFAPGHIQKRLKDWSPEGFEQKSTGFMFATTLKCRAWLKLTKIDGINGLANVYQDVCEGKITPDEGLIVEL
ncbi:MAG: hypothetical protein ACJA13_002171 [Paraglaciecola sp.]|jgi:hypothetical protein